MTPHDADGLDRSTIGAKPVRHEAVWPAIALQRPFQTLKRSPAIPALRGKHFEHLAFVIDGASHIVCLAIDFHEHLVQVPTPAECDWF